MQFGLFGKLQAKRDFIAVQTPRSFLSVFEPWLQSCISTSRMSLGAEWQKAFLTSPIWRFWLGADLCGMTVAGALMPSMDGVGRYSPLAFVAQCEPGDLVPPPDVESCDAWFAQVEDFLLSTLDPAQPFEQTTAALALFAPPSISAPAIPAQLRVVPDRNCVLGRGEAGFSSLFSDIRNVDPMSASASMTYWWTAGGQGFLPSTIASSRMPDPYLFESMLTGDFSGLLQRGEAMP